MLYSSVWSRICCSLVCMAFNVFLLTSGLKTNLFSAQLPSLCWISTFMQWHLLQCSAVFFCEFLFHICHIECCLCLFVLPGVPWRILNVLGNSLLVVEKTLSQWTCICLWCTTTRKKQFKLVTASFNYKEEPVQASQSQFEPVWASHSQFQQPGRTSLS